MVSLSGMKPILSPPSGLRVTLSPPPLLGRARTTKTRAGAGTGVSATSTTNTSATAVTMTAGSAAGNRAPLQSFGGPVGAMTLSKKS